MQNGRFHRRRKKTLNRETAQKRKRNRSVRFNALSAGEFGALIEAARNRALCACPAILLRTKALVKCEIEFIARTKNITQYLRVGYRSLTGRQNQARLRDCIQVLRS